MAIPSQKPYTQQDAAQHMYNSRAPNYDSSHHPVFAQHIASSLELKPGERLLDLACGTGLVTLPAAQDVGPTGAVVGVDITQGMLDQLVRKKAEAPEGTYDHVVIHRHDITDLTGLAGVEKGTFDAVSCASALVLLQEPAVALQHWAQYLKPGGRLITDITDKNNQTHILAMEHVYRRLGVSPPQNRIWSRDANSLKKVLLQAGLEVEKTWFKESTGEGTKYHPIEGWENWFDDAIGRPQNKALVDAGLVEQARSLFGEEWAKLAITHEGSKKIKETDGVWVGLGRKPLDADNTVVVAKGSCACGSVSWAAYAPPSASNNCYCVTCRKISGSPYIAFLDFPTRQVRFNPPLGRPFMQMYEASPHAERGFCVKCGSTLTMAYHRDPDMVGLVTGSVDEEGEDLWGLKTRHIYIDSVPKYYGIREDGLERHATMPGAERLLGDEKEG